MPYNMVDVNDVKDSDLVILQNDQVLTTSRVVAESFDKTHKHVLESINNLKDQLSTAEFSALFNESSYVASNGKTNPQYLMNRDGFSLLAMGFTGTKALQFKLKFIAAFNRMEERLKQQENKPMTALEMWELQLQVAKEHEQRLNQHEQQLQQQSVDIKRLQQAHNGMSLRHEMRDNKQQDQLNRHEADITSLQKNVYELLTEKADISQDMDIFISAVVQTYYQHIKDQAIQYKTAWKDFYNAIAEEAGRPKGYIQSLKTRQRNNLISNGMAKTTAEKRITDKTVVNSNQDLKTATISVMTRISEDINAHKKEEEQIL